MKIRDFNEIFPSYYVNPPEEYLVRRHCDAHLSNSTMPRDAYEWIERKTNPYEREAYASVTYNLISEHCVEDDWQMNFVVREEVEDHLKNIIRHAQTEEMAEEILYSEGVPSVAERPETSSTTLGEAVSRLQDQVSYLSQEVKTIKEVQQEKNSANRPAVVSPLLMKTAVRECFAKLQQAGVLDDKWQPINLSRTERAVLAYCICDKYFGSTKWKPFEDLWQMKSLRIAYVKSLELIKTSELLEKYKKLIN